MAPARAMEPSNPLLSAPTASQPAPVTPQPEVTASAPSMPSAPPAVEPMRTPRYETFSDDAKPEPAATWKASPPPATAPSQPASTVKPVPEPPTKSSRGSVPPEPRKAPAAELKPPAKQAAPAPKPEPKSPPAPSAKPGEELQQLALKHEAIGAEPAGKPPASAGERLNITLENLPIGFGAQWQLDRTVNPVTGKSQCLLASKAQNIFDGYEKTNVQLYVSSESIYVRTESNIDLSYPETGLRIDQGKLLPFERVIKKNHAAISSNVKSILSSLVSAREVVVRLGFWPSWPATSAREISFRVERFAEAINALSACDNI